VVGHQPAPRKANNRSARKSPSPATSKKTPMALTQGYRHSFTAAWDCLVWPPSLNHHQQNKSIGHQTAGRHPAPQAKKSTATNTARNQGAVFPNWDAKGPGQRSKTSCLAQSFFQLGLAISYGGSPSPESYGKVLTPFLRATRKPTLVNRLPVSQDPPRPV